MEETTIETKTDKTKLDRTKEAAEILVLTATAITAGKALFDLGVEVTSAVKARRAAKKAEDQQD